MEDTTNTQRTIILTESELLNLLGVTISEGEKVDIYNDIFNGTLKITITY